MHDPRGSQHVLDVDPILLDLGDQLVIACHQLLRQCDLFVPQPIGKLLVERISATGQLDEVDQAIGHPRHGRHDHRPPDPGRSFEVRCRGPVGRRVGQAAAAELVRHPLPSHAITRGPTNRSLR